MEILMSRKKDRTIYQHRFNLSSDDPEQEKLHELLTQLADDDRASAWIVESLIAALPGRDVPVPQSRRLERVTLNITQSRRGPKVETEEDDGEVHYVEIPE